MAEHCMRRAPDFFACRERRAVCTFRLLRWELCEIKRRNKQQTTRKHICTAARASSPFSPLDIQTKSDILPWLELLINNSSSASSRRLPTTHVSTVVCVPFTTTRRCRSSMNSRCFVRPLWSPPSGTTSTHPSTNASCYLRRRIDTQRLVRLCRLPSACAATRACAADTARAPACATRRCLATTVPPSVC